MAQGGHHAAGMHGQSREHRAAGHASPLPALRRPNTIPLRRLVHQRERVAVGIGEERHPEIVVVHRGDEMRRVREGHAALVSSATASAMSAQRK